LLKGSSDIVVGLFFDNAISAIRVIVSPAAEGKEFARSLSASPSAFDVAPLGLKRPIHP
jgi:hypothetical protein